MDFRLTAAEERFRSEVHAWLVANLPAGWGTPAFRKPEEPADKVRFARWWQRRLHEGGWAGLHWPREYGGRGASPMEQLLFGGVHPDRRAQHDRHRRRPGPGGPDAHPP